MDGKPIAPPRTVGLFGTTLFSVNGMIGAGIFALPAVLVAAVGSFAPWLMLIGGALFLPLVLVFARLASRFDHSGGPILYGQAAFGSFVGFQAGWARLASSMTTLAANTHVMVTYLAALWPVLDGPFLRPIAVVSIILAMLAINLFGMRQSVGTLDILTFIKFAPLIILIGAALFAGLGGGGVILPQFSAIESVVLLTYYAFIGCEAVVMSAGEMKKPKRDVPLGLVLGLGIVTAIYMAVIWAYLAIAPGESDAPNSLAAAGGALLGETGTVMIVIAAAISIGANTFNGGIASPRLMYGMAEQGMLPRWFMGLSRWGTPGNAIAFLAVVSVLFSLWDGFEFLAVAGTLTRMLTYLICTLALPVIEKNEGRITPATAVICVVALISSIWIASHASKEAFTMLGLILIVGTGLYFLAKREPANSTSE